MNVVKVGRDVVEFAFHQEDAPNPIVDKRLKDSAYAERKVLVFITCTVEKLKVVAAHLFGAVHLSLEPN